MSAVIRPDDRFNISTQPARDRSRTNDSDTLILGFATYECAELKARFYGQTVEDAKAKAEQALSDAIAKGMVDTGKPAKVEHKQNPVKRTIKLRDPKNAPALHSTINEWTVIGSWFRDRTTKNVKIKIPCQCKCGVIVDHPLCRLLKDAPKHCKFCQLQAVQDRRVARGRTETDTIVPKEGTLYVDLIVLAGWTRDANSEVKVTCRCKLCGSETEYMPRILRLRKASGCSRCSFGSKAA